jgi:hypothetical protein
MPAGYSGSWKELSNGNIFNSTPVVVDTSNVGGFCNYIYPDA